MDISQYKSPIKIEHAMPAEIILMIGNHLPFKSYIQLSQTCKSLQRILNSTNAIGYLNNRFKFGEDTGSLLLFTYYNILYIPEALSRLVLNHFLNSFKNNMSYLIKGWSLIHAIQCLDPGRFMTLLLADENIEKKSKEDEAKSFRSIERRKKLLVQHQRVFAKEIIDSIITSQIQCKTEVSKSKTYQTVFQKLVQSGDLRTVENCLRSLGAPIDCCITLSDSDYNNRFPLIDQQFGLKRTAEEAECDPYPPLSDKRTSNEDIPIETICRNSLYLKYNAHEMRALTEKLLEKYNVRVNSATSQSISHHNNNSITSNNHAIGSPHFGSGQYYQRHQHRRHLLRRTNN